jgi:hypothetical protein
LNKEFQQICHGLEASDEDWEKRHDGLKKIQELIKKGAGDITNFYPLFEKQVQKLLLHQVCIAPSRYHLASILFI